MKPDELKGRLRGVQVVLITPMKEDLSVDLDGLAANVSTVLEFAVDGLVVSGTYGEFPTLTSDERVDMFRVVAQAAGARVPVIACVAHSATREAVSLAERAVEAGVDGVLVAPAFLSETNPDEVVGHFRAVANAVDVGVVIYNDPDLGVYLDVPMLTRIADEVAEICGIKHGATDIRELDRLVDALGDRLALICGSDTMAIPAHVLGLDGITSSRTGPFPELIPRIWKHLEDNDVAQARRLHEGWRAYRRFSSRMGEPATMKAAHELRGRPGGPVRPPLRPLGATEREELGQVVKQIVEFMAALDS
jgi:4-hydroxy-tetrahydrodipicolinate synthase